MSDSSWNDMNTNYNNNLDYALQIEVNGVLYPSVNISIHGASSRGFAKKSYKLDFDAPHPYGPFYSASEEILNQVILNAGWVDPSFLRQKLVFDLINAMGGLAPRFSWAEISRNGVFYGFYQFAERIDKDFFSRVGLDPTKNVYKGTSHSSNWDWKNGGYLYGYDYSDALSPYSDIEAVYSSLEYTPRTFNDWQADVAPLLDLSQWFIYSYAHTYASDYDAFCKNYYLYGDPTDPRQPMVPISWDSDATWGNNWDGQPKADQSKIYGAFNPDGTDNLSWKLFGISEYMDTYLLGWREFLKPGNLGDPAVLATWIENNFLCINASALKDEAVWSKINGGTARSQSNFMKQAIATRNNTLQAIINAGLTGSSQNHLFDEFGLPLFNGAVYRTRTLAPPTAPIVISEVYPANTTTDSWIELYNPSNTTSVNVSLNWVTDNKYNRAMAQIRSDFPLITPNQYVTITLGDLVNIQSAFNFSSSGDLFALYTTEGAKHDGVSIDRAPPGISIGLYHTSDGQDKFVRLSGTSKNGANSYPYIGDIVISKISFNPLTGQDPYIEFTSLSNSDINLFDSANNSITWRIDGLGPFYFPTGNYVPGKSKFYVTNTNPLTFSKKYGVSINDQVFGPYPGSLDAFEEKIQLKAPYYDATTQSYKYYVVDEIKYFFKNPWPVSNHTPISKLSLSSYGNDPANWRLTSEAAITCSADSNCPYIDACTISTCVNSTCTYNLRTCVNGDLALVNAYKKCWPHLTCDYVPPTPPPTETPPTDAPTSSPTDAPGSAPVSSPVSPPGSSPVSPPGSSPVSPPGSNPVSPPGSGPVTPGTPTTGSPTTGRPSGASDGISLLTKSLNVILVIAVIIVFQLI
eukprot:TRINITY_DN7526_c0_g2_i1.p1 TRINITY_DN7526_c0_g2~~TRINITY_DN7526_c0_g2_i1.p1  ORF type:complete len:906 (-),score=245.88 TRINITY_DN7526_c0_g2_i1:28-2604(-)